MADTRQIEDQRRGQGGGDQRQQSHGGGGRTNAEISLEAKAAEVIRRIGASQAEIEAVLPRNVTFNRFQASIATALRKNPELLECYLPSLINAALQSAHDGILPDGKEGAIVAHNVKYQEKPDKWRKEAVWFPMVAGLRKRIMQSGLVSDVKTKVVYANEAFDWEEGLNQRLVHKPILGNAQRGKPIAAYAIAWLRDGTETFEVMSGDEIREVQKEAKTAFVWTKWEGEMWRKTVLRRFRKSLPAGRDVLDTEAKIMFPHFSTEPAMPLLTDEMKAPPRPVRQAFLEYEQTLETDLGGGWSGQPEPEHVDRDQPRQERQQQRREPAGDQRQDPPAEEGGDQGGEMKAGEWDAWLVKFKSAVKTRSSTAKLKTLQEAEKANIEAAPEAIGRAAQQILDERFDALRDLGN